jgi:hypothetical protein
MGRVVRLISDVSGVEAIEAAFEKCVVRRHPVISEAKRLDVLPGELDGLRRVTALVVLEIGQGPLKQELVVTHREFSALVADDVVSAAPARAAGAWGCTRRNDRKIMCTGIDW